MNTITFDDFKKIDFRIGTVTQAEVFKEAKKPAYKLMVDLGGLGVKKSSAQITDFYKPEELIGKQVLCVCNFSPRQIGPLMSEVLVTGFILNEDKVVLAQPERKIPNGTKLA